MLVRVLMVWCVALGTVVLPLAADGPSELADQVPYDVWGWEALQYMISWGVIQGYPDGPLRSDRVMTRYEFAVAWARFAEANRLLDGQFSLDSVVTDVPVDHWARQSVEKLAGAGLLTPSRFKDGDPFLLQYPGVARLSPEPTDHLTYGGDRPLLRREFAEMVLRTSKLWNEHFLHELVEENRFPQLRGYASTLRSRLDRLARISPISLLVETGVFIGYPDGTIRLDEAMTRWQFCMATARVNDGGAYWGGPL
jgi:hypothetical protein